MLQAHDAACALETSRVAAQGGGRDFGTGDGGGGVQARGRERVGEGGVRFGARPETASPAMETSRILDSVCRIGQRLSVGDWVVWGRGWGVDREGEDGGVGGLKGGGGAAAVALTLSAMARASYRNDALLLHLCAALVHCARGRGGEGLGERREEGGKMSPMEVAQVTHALASLCFRHDEVTRFHTLHPPPWTLDPRPWTLDPKPQALSPELQALDSQSPTPPKAQVADANCYVICPKP
jgi:hypothetical protein